MKTISTGIRYKEDEISFIKKRENLNTVQNVFSFLVLEYLKLYKAEKKSVFEVNSTASTPESYDGIKNKRYEADEVTMWQEPIKDYPYYENLGKTVKYDDAEELIREILSSNLKPWQKPMLQKMINARFFDN